MSNTPYSESFIQAAAPRATWEQGIGLIFENRGTNRALNPVTQGLFFFSPAAPFVNDPKGKNGSKTNK
jgi:hypothetical protein